MRSRAILEPELAARHLARLNQAADKGGAFDVDTGLPDSMARERSTLTWYTHACEYVDYRWPDLSAKGRLSLAEGLIAGNATSPRRSTRAPASSTASPRLLSTTGAVAERYMAL